MSKIRQFKPSKVIVYLDGTTVLDPYHFADIIKSLSEHCNNNIVLYLPESKLNTDIKSNVQNSNFFSKYMNYQVKTEDKLRMIDYITAFMNVTSKQYYPATINIT